MATDFGGKYISIDTPEEKISLKELLVLVKSKFPSYFPIYFDEDFTPKRGTLILINGVDFNTLDSLDTLLTARDQISFVPTISGG